MKSRRGSLCTLALTGLALGLLTGCGLKGDLYLEEPQTPTITPLASEPAADTSVADNPTTDSDAPAAAD